jgi:hypothetical protein
MNKISYTSILLLIVFIACKNNPNSKEAIREKLLDAPNMNAGKENYTIDAPEGWTTEYKTYNGVNYYILNAPKTKDDPNTCMNVVTEDMHNLSLDVYLQKTIESLMRIIPSVSILEQGDLEANGIKGGWYSYTMEVEGVTSSVVAYIIPKNGIAYIISAGTQVKDAARYRNLFDATAKTLKVVK